MSRDAINDAQDYIRKKILETINLTKITDDLLEQQVREEVDRYFKGTYVPIENKALLIDQVFSSIRGLDFWTRSSMMIRSRKL